MVPGCVDPRGCPFPPTSTNAIYGEFDGGGTLDKYARRIEFNQMIEKQIDEIEVGTSFWYMCRDGEY